MVAGFSGLGRKGKAAVLSAGLVAAAASWMFLTSTVFVIGTGLWKTEQAVPFLEAYAYWQAYPSDPRVMQWVRIGAIGSSLILALVGIAILLRRPKKSLHGQTGFASNRDLFDSFRGSKEAILCGRKGDYLRFAGDRHVALYAPTDSGKGVSIAIPNALLWDGSLVAYDPKKELYRLTSGVRSFCHQEVHLFDPLDQNSRTSRYNPFTYVKRGGAAGFDDIQRIGQVLFPAVSGNEDFWQSAARSAFNGVAALLSESPNLPFTIGEVYRTLTRADGPIYLQQMIDDREEVGRPFSQAVLSALSDYLAGSENLVNSVRRSVTTRLELWNNPLVDIATEASDFDLRDLRKNLMAVYVGVSPDNVERLRPLLILFFQQMLDIIAQQGEPKSNPLMRRKLLVLLDEFPMLGRMDKLAEAFSWIRSYGVRFLMIIQSKSQLRGTYGPDVSRTMMENCGAEIIFGTDDVDLLREISERLGYNTVSAVSRSRPGSLLSQKGGDSQTTSDQRRALMLPQEIRTLSPTKCIILTPALRPVLADRIIYWRDKSFTKLLLQAPEVRPIVPPPPAVDPLTAAPTTALPVEEQAAPILSVSPLEPEPRATPTAADDEPGSLVAASAPDQSHLHSETSDHLSAFEVGTRPGLPADAASATDDHDRGRPAPVVVKKRGRPAPLRSDEGLPTVSSDIPETSPMPKRNTPSRPRKQAVASTSSGSRASRDTSPMSEETGIVSHGNSDPVIHAAAATGRDPRSLGTTMPSIWNVINAAEPDLHTYGLAKAEDWVVSIVRQLPGEEVSAGRAAIGD